MTWLNIQPDTARRNALYLLLTEGGTKFLSLLSFVIMARGLSQQSYGMIALAFSVGSLFFVFFNLGLDYHLIRDISHSLGTRDRDALRELLSTVATLKIWILPLFIGIFVLLFWALRWDRGYFPVMLLIFLYFYLISAVQLTLFIFRAFEKMKYEFVARSMQAVVLLVVTLLFGFLYKSPLLLSAGYAVVAGALLLGVCIFCARKLQLIPQVGHWIRKREAMLVGKVKYLFFIGVTTSIFSGVDILVISKVRSIEDVAIYKNAVMITLALFMIPTAVVQGFFPRLVQPREKLGDVVQAMKHILSRLFPLGVVIALAFFIAAPQLITLIFGDSYVASMHLFRLSLIAFIFATVNQVFGYGMIAIGEYRSYFLITLLVSVISVVLNVALITRIGLLGGILTMGATHFLLIILPVAYLYALRMRDIRAGAIM